MEGISSPKSNVDSSAQSNPWETPPTVFPEQDNSSPSQLPPLSSPPEPPLSIAYKSPSQIEHGGNVASGSGGSIKKLIKLGIGMFVVLTIFLIIITLIFSKFSKPTIEDVTLTYWGLGEDESVIRPVIDEFEKENPHIKIDYKKQDPIEYRERLTVRTQNGVGPDIFRYHNTWYPMLSDLLLPLPNEVIEKKEFENIYYDVAKGDLIKNGTIYGIPLQTDTLALFVNTQLFDQGSAEIGSTIPIPRTWQEFNDASTALTKREPDGSISQSGAAIGTFENVNHAPDIISLLFAQNGVDFSNLSNSKDQIADALRFYTAFASVRDNVWDSTQDNSLLAFSQGKVAMYFGYSSDFHAIKAQNPNIVMKVVPVPQLISDEKINIASYWVEGASSKSKHPKEALIFMNYLAKPQTQEKLFAQASKTRTFGEPYSNKNLADKLKNSEAFVFVDQSNTAISTPFVDGTNDNGLNSKLNNYLKEAVNAIFSGGSEESSVSTFLQGYLRTRSEYSGISR